MNHQVPGIDNSKLGNFKGAFDTIMDKFLQSFDVCLPARVIKQSDDRQKVTVQPLIMRLASDYTSFSRSKIENLNVFTFGGGGFCMSANLPEGSLGWIVAADRDTSLFMQDYAESGINTLRKHNFSDAWFIPDVITGYEINPEDSEAFLIQSLEGAIKISLSSERIKISKGETTLVINENSITAVATTIDLNGVIIDQDGKVTGPKDAIFGGISSINHTHAQPNDSGGNTEHDTEKPS